MEFQNPIDEKKVAQNPGLLAYAHTVGGAIIKPIDEGKTKTVALRAMYEQSDVQLLRIKKQVEALLLEAQEVHERIQVSEEIYKAKLSFKPVIGQTYFYYRTKDNAPILSLVSPEEWNGKCPYSFEASVKLLADHTWQVVNK